MDATGIAAQEVAGLIHELSSCFSIKYLSKSSN